MTVHSKTGSLNGGEIERGIPPAQQFAIAFVRLEGDARTSMGHRRRCGARGWWGRLNRNGPRPPPWGLGPSAESSSKVVKVYKTIRNWCPEALLGPFWCPASALPVPCQCPAGALLQSCHFPCNDMSMITYIEFYMDRLLLTIALEGTA